jgi:hypothetical protein
LPVPGGQDDVLFPEEPGERRRELDLERQGRLQGRQQPRGLLRFIVTVV